MASTGRDPTARRRTSIGPVVDAFGRRIKKIHHENTYRMEPKTLFPVEKATMAIKDAMKWRLSDVYQFDPDKCMGLCKTLANDIKENIKDLAVGFFIVY